VSTDELLTVEELASLFKLTRWTIYNLTRKRNRREGALPYLVIGRELRFRRSAVEAWITSQEVTR
jgi:excisionase family DNA binding protein